MVKRVTRLITDAEEVTVPNVASHDLCNPGFDPDGTRPSANFFCMISHISTRMAASSVVEIVVSPMVGCKASPDFFSNLASH